MRTKFNSVMIGPLLLMIAQYTNQIVWPLVNLLVVRYLGSEQFGLYASAIAIITLLSLLPDFGLQQGALNLNARRQFAISSILRKSLKLGLLYATIAFAVVMLWVYAVNYEEAIIKWLAILLGVTFFRIAIVTVVTSGLQVQGKYSRIAFWNLMISSSQWISTLILIFYGAGLYLLVVGPIVISLTVTLVMFLVQGRDWYKNRRGDSKEPEPDAVVTTRELLRSSWKFGLASSMHQLYYKSDAAVLSVFRNPIEVGYYTVAFKMIELFFLFPGVLFNQVLYPKYCIWCREDIPKLKSYYNLMNKLMILTGILVAFGLMLFSSEILRLLFGENHPEAVLFLSLLAIAIPLRFWVSSIGAVLTNEKLITEKLKIQTGIALFNVIMNLLLIPFFGGMGAALTMIATHLLLLVAYGFTAHKHLFGFNKTNLKQWIYPLFLTSIGIGLYFIVNEQQVLVKIAACALFTSASLPITWVWFVHSEKTHILSLVKLRRTSVSKELAGNRV